jgi:hypothetical protein
VARKTFARRTQDAHVDAVATWLASARAASPSGFYSGHTVRLPLPRCPLADRRPQLRVGDEACIDETLPAFRALMQGPRPRSALDGAHHCRHPQAVEWLYARGESPKEDPCRIDVGLERVAGAQSLLAAARRAVPSLPWKLEHLWRCEVNGAAVGCHRRIARCSTTSCGTASCGTASGAITRRRPVVSRKQRLLLARGGGARGGGRAG